MIGSVCLLGVVRLVGIGVVLNGGGFIMKGVVGNFELGSFDVMTNGVVFFFEIKMSLMLFIIIVFNGFLYELI